MADVNQLARDWQHLIDIADHQLGIEGNPLIGASIRNAFHHVIAIFGDDKVTATALLEAMEGITRELKTSRDTSFFAGQLIILSILMADMFPATTGLVARGYECGVKSFHADKIICPN